jgi:ABC-type Fe3+/spermidine/putrescine transport system ATPase subunit
MLEADGGFIFLADMTGKECEGNKVHVVIRHEVIKISKNKPKAKKGLNSFKADVTFRAFSGSSIEFMATLPEGPEIMLEADNDENSQSIFPGDSVWVSWDPKAALINEMDG